jgi:hypothetical protein
VSSDAPRQQPAVAALSLDSQSECTNGVHFRELVSAVSAGNCVAFLGSGFFGPMGGPHSSWKTTLRLALEKCINTEDPLFVSLAKRLEETRVRSANIDGAELNSSPATFLEIAQAIEDKVGEHRFVTVLQELLGMPGAAECAAAHWWPAMKRRIALVRAIPFRCVLSTNYTDAFGCGRELSEADLSLFGAVRGSRSVDGTDMGAATSAREIALLRCILSPENPSNALPPVSAAADVEVLHIHGLKKPVLSQQGMNLLRYRTSAFQPFLTTLLATSTVFYFGFSFSDSYLAELQAQV